MSDTTFSTTSPRSALASGLMRAAVALLALAAIGGLFALAAHLGAPSEAPSAPRHPFGMGLRETAPEPTGIGSAILAVQASFYSRMIAALQGLSGQGLSGQGLSGHAAAFWTLIALSFTYGVFHAAGPGHGKAVISGYLVADGRRSLPRGLGLAFASSLLQALSAIAIVAVLALALGATAEAINASARMIERASFALVALVGLLVLWRKSGRLLAVMRAAPPASPPAAPATGADPFAGLAFQPAHASRPQAAGQGRFRADAVRADDVLACADPLCAAGGACNHLLTPAELGRIGSLREMAMVALSAGLRPCTGAIIVLVFAFARGMPAAGIAAAFAMALGTFITVGALASAAVFAKRLASRMAGGSSAAGRPAIAVLEVLASALVAVVGIVLVIG